MSSVAIHAQSRPDACSVIGDRKEASAYGTASVARFWVALEQPGPWGREAAAQSHLDPATGIGLDRLCQERGGRFILIRRPGTHADAHQAASCRVYLAGALDDRPWLLAGDLDDPADLGLVPWDAMADGDLDAVQEALPQLEESTSPVLLVCTNAKRDVCCAVRGRPVALEAGSARPGQVWECSHTGGHRFAPTGVLLPHGQTLSRLTPALATAVLDAAGTGRLPAEVLGPVHDRGRSPLDPPAQAAESHIRAQTREVDLTALSTTAEPEADAGAAGGWCCTVRHRDGRSWQVRAVRTQDDHPRPESCGKAPRAAWTWSCAPG